MDRSLSGVDRKLPATAGNHWQAQRPLRIHAEAPPARALMLLPAMVLIGATFTAVLGFALIHSGEEQRAIAREICISDGYLSRFVSGIGEQWAKRLVRYIRATGSLGPLQWIADQLGCEVVLRSNVEAELAEARARVAELERRAAA